MRTRFWPERYGEVDERGGFGGASSKIQKRARCVIKNSKKSDARKTKIRILKHAYVLEK